ncbi:sugar phosphate isomerase/epimerase family protein [Desulfoferrobacter suflitae]|uniref:sugar phosphate isomerase/epimerase family protein n=1 Tax=Desulfoferrobacter suflitae TaxID=2865782 RepID=UPI0021642CD9|nr:sugar phosphate isomerase/epimerase [Desulfoferrobacter suflitae]MCK8601206.1 sugar phosphate isomerase/epimerase [Desulfoferrobacter suflitae]
MAKEHGTIVLGGTARTPQEVLLLQRLGLQFAEISIEDAEQFAGHLDRYRTVMEETGLFFLCHGPREGDPSDTDTLEKVYFPKLCGVLGLMPQLRMKLLTMHLWMDPRFLSPEVIQYKIDFLARLLDVAGSSKVTICLENLSETAEHLAAVFTALPELRMTLDLGHAQLLTHENTSFAFLQNYPQRIRHMHLHDNRGGNSPDADLHLPVGHGIIDFPSIFAAVRNAAYCGTITLELRVDEIEQCLGCVRKLLEQSCP